MGFNEYLGTTVYLTQARLVALMQGWDNITLRYLRTVIGSLPARMTTVINAIGSPSRYCTLKDVLKLHE